MNRQQRNRKALRQRCRVVLLTTALSCAATSAFAETRFNPFINASARNAPSTIKITGGHASQTDAVGNPESVILATIDFDVADRLMSEQDSASPVSQKPVSQKSVSQKPLRLPRVQSTRSSVDARPKVAAVQHQAVQHQIGTRPLQSITTNSCNNRATQLLDDAYREYSVAAWASAEASAWKALELIATGIDVANHQTAPNAAVQLAAKNLSAARTAIREARHFVVSGAAVATDRVAGIASSHETPILSDGTPAGFTSIDAVDRYLDHARFKLASLAIDHAQAAQAMDLIAAIMLGRNETKWLPEETSLCLRRAALQGQPNNASLASRLGMQLAHMGLDDEAQLTLNHAMSLDPNHETAQALAQLMNRLGDQEAALRLTTGLRKNMPAETDVRRVPEVIQLTPAQFASISPALNASRSSAAASSQSASPQSTAATYSADASRVTAGRKSRFTPASLAGFRWLSPKRSNQVGRSDEVRRTDEPTETQSTIKRFLGKMPKLW